MRRLTSIVLLASLAFATPVLGQEFPDPAAILKMRLAAFAAPFLAAEGPNLDQAELAATVVCVVEALDPLPDAVKEQMLAMADFEDALDFAVTQSKTAGLPIEERLEACF